jgi:hypothetical protein
MSEPTDQPTSPHALYASIPDSLIDAIATAWWDDPIPQSFARHVNVSIADAGYGWDPTLTDEQNRDAFDAVCDRVRRVIHGPMPGTVRDQHGEPCPAASVDSYPLVAECRCGLDIEARDGQAEWCHR